MRRLAWLARLSIAVAATTASGVGAEEPLAELRYRRLSASDFRAGSPPRELSVHGEHLLAGSCLRVAWSPEQRVGFANAATGSVRARVTSPEFFATFDPECSWLSPDVDDVAAVVEHEQVHFAIVEHAAQELTREFRDETVRGRGPTSDAALTALRAAMRRLADRATRRARKEHLAYDAATRSDASGAAHRQWVARYDALLGASTP